MESADPRLVELVELVRSFKYGRPSNGTVEAMLRERRGTCSTKHLFLAEGIRSTFPDCEPRLIHRVYRIDAEQARKTFGDRVADAIPSEGLVDVHRYLTIELNERRVVVDATFPGPPWNGVSDLPLACGTGTDYPSEGNADAEKRQLEARFCDSDLREKYIAALSSGRP